MSLVSPNTSCSFRRPENSTQQYEPRKFFSDFVPYSKSRPFLFNLRALSSRFVQLCLRPDHLGLVVLDFWSLLLSLWGGGDRNSGPDLLYPLSSLKKHKSGRLARLLLEHSRDMIQQANIRDASSLKDGVEPPRAVVMDLDEVPSEIIERGYAAPADFYGFVVMIVFLETIIALFLHIFAPVDASPFYEWLDRSMTSWFGDSLGVWFAFLVGIFAPITPPWTFNNFLTVTFCIYAVFRGEGTITLVRKSDISIPGCAVLLDQDLTVILTGPQNIVEAIAESRFTTSHPLMGSRQQVSREWQSRQLLRHEALNAFCRGAFFAMLAGIWLLRRPTSPIIAFVPLVVVMFAVQKVDARRILDQQDSMTKTVISALSRYLLSTMPTFLLVMLYILKIAKNPIFQSFFQPGFWLYLLPDTFVTYHFISFQSYNIWTPKFLEVLGPPPVRRWEFDTLAAAVTFQCLFLCRGIPRPINNINVLALLATFVPDERDVWMAWKARVADRITHEVDISFAPTVPLFGDARQIHLKELLDQAQVGYAEFRRFYDQHVPPNRAVALY